MRARLTTGDWIVGVAGKSLRERIGRSDQWRLVYAMKIREVLTLKEYFESPSYQFKKPKWNGVSAEMCGDNFYAPCLKRGNGLRHTGATEEHKGLEEKDCRGNRVFIGAESYYFGSLAPEFPSEIWGKKLRTKFENSAVGLRYMRGGSGDQWTDNDLKRFITFLEEGKVETCPVPINFDHWDQWKIAGDTNGTCGSCSK